MRHHRFEIWFVRMLLFWGMAQTGIIYAQVNSWNNSQSGTWEWGGTTNWSLNAAPALSQSAIFITNVVNGPLGGHFRTINIDATTPTSTLTISNLTLSAPGSGFTTGSHNTINLANNAGSNAPLNIIKTLFIANGGNLFITNSTLQLEGLGFFSVDGILTLDTGTIITTNVGVNIGDQGIGSATISDGTWLGSDMEVGLGSGSSGALFINGGTVTLSDELLIGVNGVGAVTLSGGQLNETNDAYVGENNIGQMTVNSGIWVAGNVYMGNGPAAQGTLTIAGGTSNYLSNLEIGYGSLTTGTVWLTSGQLNVTNETSVGYGGIGQMTVSNGTWTANNVYIANQFISSLGTLTVAGGTNNLSNLQITSFANTTGTVWLTGGQLNVTNQTIIGNHGIAQMTISNGIWLTGSVGVGDVVGSSGTLTIAGGTNTLSSSLEIALSGGAAGTLWLTGGQLNATNTTIIGDNGVGQMTVSNGLWIGGNVNVSGGSSSSQGTLTIAGGSTTLSSLAIDSVSTGTVWLTGGQLSVTGAQTMIANSLGVGRMIVSNGTWQSQGFVVGDIGHGTLIIAGGTNTMFNPSMAGENGGTGTVWITGGILDASGQEIDLGAFHGVGQMTISNGTVRTTYLLAGTTLGAGTVTIAGGTNTVLGFLEIGEPDCSATGIVTVTGGNLFVTNATGNAVLDVENGTFTLSSGTVVVDTFVMTNACAHFVRTGGTLIYNTAVLNPNADTDGDGIPNGYEQAHGLDPLNPADANLDNDGDGFSNLQEYLAGTNPNDPNSTPFRVTSILPQGSGHNILLTWTTVGGTTNQVQVTQGTGNGNYATNGFTNLSSQLLIVGSGLVTNNYIDTGGATNAFRYYRVRLVP
jgi:thrombospondin type 3 repeat protein